MFFECLDGKEGKTGKEKMTEKEKDGKKKSIDDAEGNGRSYVNS